MDAVRALRQEVRELLETTSRESAVLRGATRLTRESHLASVGEQCGAHLPNDGVSGGIAKVAHQSLDVLYSSRETA